jgi:hypothetical protein
MQRKPINERVCVCKRAQVINHFAQWCCIVVEIYVRLADESSSGVVVAGWQLPLAVWLLMSAECSLGGGNKDASRMIECFYCDNVVSRSDFFLFVWVIRSAGLVLTTSAIYM